MTCLGEAKFLDMWRYLAVTLLSHSSRFSLEKTIQMLENLGASAPSLRRARRVSTHIKDYTAIGRGRTGERTCSSQTDQTVQIESFINAAFAL
jgi:hypothetical protein